MGLRDPNRVSIEEVKAFGKKRKIVPADMVQVWKSLCGESKQSLSEVEFAFFLHVIGQLRSSGLFKIPAGLDQRAEAFQASLRARKQPEKAAGRTPPEQGKPGAEPNLRAEAKAERLEKVERKNARLKQEVRELRAMLLERGAGHVEQLESQNAHFETLVEDLTQVRQKHDKVIAFMKRSLEVEIPNKLTETKNMVKQLLGESETKAVYMVSFEEVRQIEREFDALHREMLELNGALRKVVEGVALARGPAQTPDREAAQVEGKEKGVPREEKKGDREVEKYSQNYLSSNQSETEDEEMDLGKDLRMRAQANQEEKIDDDFGNITQETGGGSSSNSLGQRETPGEERGPDLPKKGGDNPGESDFEKDPFFK